MNNKMIHSLLDKVVKVDIGGHETRVGMLVSAQDDHFILLTETAEIIYYNTQHINSLTYNTKNQVQLGFEVPENVEFIKADDIKGILEKLTLQSVKINRGGPETLEGVIDYVDEDYITIVSNEEIIRIALFHIRNISYGAKIEKTEEINGEKEKITNNG